MSPPMTDTNTHGLPIAVSSAIMVASVVVIFSLFIFFLILYLRSTLYTGAARGPDNSSNYFDGGGNSLVSRRALPLSVLKSLPISVFSSVEYNGGVECAVCLSEFTDGEHFRQLPVCNHPFHTDCIDIWFSSNSTCPICRSTVEAPKTEDLKNNSRALPPWIGMGRMAVEGSDVGSSSSTGLNRPCRIVVVQVPRNVEDSSGPVLQSGDTRAAVEVKLPALERTSSRGWDIEQGVTMPAVGGGVRV